MKARLNFDLNKPADVAEFLSACLGGAMRETLVAILSVFSQRLQNSVDDASRHHWIDALAVVRGALYDQQIAIPRGELYPQAGRIAR